MNVFAYLNVIIDAAAVGALQIKDWEGIVDSIASDGLDGPTAVGVMCVIVGKIG